MIIREFYLTREDGINLYRTYSDDNFKIQKVGTKEVYEEAIDIEPLIFNYIETTETWEPVQAVVEKNNDIIEEPEIENGDQELTDEEISEMLKEVF